MQRRHVLTMLALSTFASMTLGIAAQAQTSWPDRPVKVIVPYAPGGATDAIARPWCDELSKAFGQQFVIENRGGASGMIGVEAATKATADGYTLIMTPAAPLTILPSLRKTPYDPEKGLQPIGRTGDVLNGLTIHPSVGVKTMKEFVEYAKKNPGKLTYGSSGSGTATHIRIEALKLRAGLDILHVPYRGGADSLNDLLPGTIQLMNEPVTLPHVKAGKLILLSINGQQRNPDFPDIPTLTEVGIKDADIPIWFGMYGPVGTPKDVVAKLNAKMIELAKQDEMKKRLWAVNAIVPLQTPDEMLAAIREDIKINADIIKAANVKME